MWIAYKMHATGETGIADCKDTPTHLVSERLQKAYRDKGQPAGITTISANTIADALIATTRL